MAGLAYLLSNFPGREVVDETELIGKYDVKLELMGIRTDL